jgi:hypothetical protein
VALIHGMAEGINRKLRRLINSLKDRQADSLCLKGRRLAPQGAPRRSSSAALLNPPRVCLISHTLLVLSFQNCFINCNEIVPSCRTR